MGIKVRLATDGDIDNMVVIGREFWDSTHYNSSGMTFDPEKSKGMVIHCLSNGILAVAEDDGELVGFFIAMITENPFSRDLECVELAFFVRPDYRRFGVGRLLLLRAIKESKAKNLKTFSSGSVFSGTPEAVKQLYESVGMKITEMTFSMTL